MPHCPAVLQKTLVPNSHITVNCNFCSPDPSPHHVTNVKSQRLANAKFISTVHNRCLFLNIKQTLHCHMQPQTGICILYSTMQHPGTQPTESRTAGAHGKWLSRSQIKSTIRRLSSRSSPLYTHPCVLAVLCKTHNIAYRLVASIKSVGTPFEPLAKGLEMA